MLATVIHVWVVSRSQVVRFLTPAEIFQLIDTRVHHWPTVCNGAIFAFQEARRLTSDCFGQYP
jgi:hypothetical protein